MELTQSQTRPYAFHCTKQASLTILTAGTTVIILPLHNDYTELFIWLYLTQLHEEGLFNSSHFTDGKTDVQRGQVPN